MKHGYFEEHWVDPAGNPGGGVSTGVGFTISWQNGSLGYDAQRPQPNGAFVEDVLQAVIGRLRFYQQSPFACEENAEALHALEVAADWLAQRTKERAERGVEGMHVP